MINKIWRNLFIAAMAIIITSQSQAGEVFRYKFDSDSTVYNLSIESEFQFPYLEGLARLLEIDSLKHDFDMDIEMVVQSRQKEKGALVKIRFTEISSITTVGDSVFSDDNVGWGDVKPGADFLVLITARGEISLLNKVNLKAGRQVVDMMQRFMPVFPDMAIAPDFTWSDTIGFDLELPQQDLQRIETVVGYTCSGRDEFRMARKFDYRLQGETDSTPAVTLSGTGQLYFDNERGLIIENHGLVTIDTEISLSTFGLPEVLGTTPVHIDSEIKLILNSDE